MVGAQAGQGGVGQGVVVRVVGADGLDGGHGGLLVAAHGGQGFGIVAQKEVFFLAAHLQRFDAGGHGQALQGQGALGMAALQDVHDKHQGEAGHDDGAQRLQLALDAQGHGRTLIVLTTVSLRQLPLSVAVAAAGMIRPAG